MSAPHLPSLTTKVTPPASPAVLPDASSSSSSSSSSAPGNRTPPMHAASSSRPTSATAAAGLALPALTLAAAATASTGAGGAISVHGHHSSAHAGHAHSSHSRSGSTVSVGSASGSNTSGSGATPVPVSPAAGAYGGLTSPAVSPPATPRARAMADTGVDMTELIDGQCTDEHGRLTGAQLLKWMDLVSCMSAERFSGHSSVTAAMDDFQLVPGAQGADRLVRGALVLLKAQVNRAFGSSMEVGCKVWAEDLHTGQVVPVASSYFTFVSLKPDGTKLTTGLPPLTCHTDDENNRRRYLEAAERRALRLQRRGIILQLANDLKQQQANERAAAATAKAAAAAAAATGATATGTGAASADSKSAAAAATPADSKSAVSAPAAAAAPATVAPRSPTVGSASIKARARAFGGTVAAAAAAHYYANGTPIPSIPGLDVGDDDSGGSSSSGSNSAFPVKSPSVSYTQLTELILPVHTNHMGHCFGGMTMAWMQTCSLIAATRFTRKPMRLVSIDDIFFLAGIRVGDRCLVRACANRAFGTTLEIGCRVERLSLGGTIEHALTAFVSYSCADGTAIPFRLEPDADDADQQRRYWDAMGRRKVRLARKVLRSHATGLSCPWSKASASELIYANIRGLCLASNRAAFASDQPWEVLHRHPEAHLTLSMRQSPQNLITCVRMDAPVRGTPKQLFDFLVDLHTRELWDGVFSNATVVEPIDGHNDIVHFRTRPPAPPQDFVLLRSWRAQPSHTSAHSEYVISNRSVLHSAVPPVAGWVRAEVLSSGFVLQPLRRPALAYGSAAKSNSASATAAASHGLAPTTASVATGSKAASAAGGGGGGGGGDEWTHVQYVVQLGTKALALVSGDLVGEQSKSIVKSFLSLQKLCAERFGGAGAGAAAAVGVAATGAAAAAK